MSVLGSIRNILLLLLGWLCDRSPSPQTAFYMAGALMMTAGLVSLTLRPLINKRKRNAHKTTSTLTIQLPLIALHKASTSSDLRSFHSTMFVLQPVCIIPLTTFYIPGTGLPGLICSAQECMHVFQQGKYHPLGDDLGLLRYRRRIK